MNRVRPYERRRRGPIVVLAAALAAVAAVTWTVVLATAGGSTPISCPAPAAGGGEALDVDALDSVALAPVDTIAVRVLNAGTQRGQANLVAAQLGDLGFREAAGPDNDPLHPGGDMECIGQLRFGPQGESAAATLALVLPCTEPVRDGRGDATVDVVVGTEFRDVDPPAAVRQVLDELANPTPTAAQTAEEEDPATDPATAPPRPVAPPEALATARGDAC